MADHLGVAKRSWNMSRIRSKNTTPELIVRRTLTEQGIKYRLHVRSLPGNPDIVIRKTRSALFVNGCFWHQHQGCKRSTKPKSNEEYWNSKLIGNVQRQRKAITELRKENWNIVTVWECESKDQAALLRRLKELRT